MPKASRVSVGRTLSRSIFFWKLMIGSSIILSWISVGGITMLQSMKSAMALVTSFSVWARKASRQKTCQSTNTEGIYAPIKAVWRDLPFWTFSLTQSAIRAPMARPVSL